MDSVTIRVAVEKAIAAHKACEAAGKAYSEAHQHGKTVSQEYKLIVKELETIIGPGSPGVLYGNQLIRITGYGELEFVPIVNPVDIRERVQGIRAEIGIGGPDAIVKQIDIARKAHFEGGDGAPVESAN